MPDGRFNSNPADDLLNRPGSESYSSDPMQRLLRRVGQASYTSEDTIIRNVSYWTPHASRATGAARDFANNWANGAYDNELNLAKDIALGALDAMAATPKGRVAVAVVSGVLALAKYAAAEIVSATTPEGEVNEAAAAANASISTVEGAEIP